MEPKKPGRPRKLNCEALQRIREVIAARMKYHRVWQEALAAQAAVTLNEMAEPPSNAQLAAELGMSLTTLRLGISEVLDEQ
jgi:hypothetical protein